MSDRRKLTPAEIEDQRRGSTRLGPGVWMDRDGGLHFSVPELLEVFDLEDTPANRARVEQLAEDALRRQLPDATIIKQD